jgi:hypothetical protein
VAPRCLNSLSRLVESLWPPLTGHDLTASYVYVSLPFDCRTLASLPMFPVVYAMKQIVLTTDRLVLPVQLDAMSDTVLKNGTVNLE